MRVKAAGVRVRVRVWGRVRVRTPQGCQYVKTNCFCSKSFLLHQFLQWV
jgi:hypothetical protein